MKDKEELEKLYKTEYIDGFLIEEYINTNTILVSHKNVKYELFIKGILLVCEIFVNKYNGNIIR